MEGNVFGPQSESLPTKQGASKQTYGNKEIAESTSCQEDRENGVQQDETKRKLGKVMWIE